MIYLFQIDLCKYSGVKSFRLKIILQPGNILRKGEWLITEFDTNKQAIVNWFWFDFKLVIIFFT